MTTRRRTASAALLAALVVAALALALPRADGVDAHRATVAVSAGHETVTPSADGVVVRGRALGAPGLRLLAVHPVGSSRLLPVARRAAVESGHASVRRASDYRYVVDERGPPAGS